MTLPEEVYHQSVIYCSEEEEWEVKDAVNEYESIRSVCLSYQRSMQNYRIMYLLVNFSYLSSELFNVFAKGKFFIVPVYLLIAVILVIFLKSLIGAAVSSLMLLTIVNDIDAFAIIPVWALFAANVYLAYVHEKKKRYLKSQHGYPEFHPLVVKVKKDFRYSAPDSSMPMETGNDDMPDDELL